MKLKSKRLVVISVAAVVAIIIGCAQVKQLGDSIGGKTGQYISSAATAGEAATVDKSKAKIFGKSTAIELTNRYKISQNQYQQVYVNYVGHTLASVSSLPGGHYVFCVLDDPSVGAFSGAYGYIFITRGALERAQNEAEVAGLLGHEMTHVVKEHSLDDVRGAMVREGLTEALNTATNMNMSQAMPLFDAAVNAGTNKAFSQPQETEADQGAVTLMIAAGYDPNSFVNYLKRIEQEQAANPGNGEFSTHPGIPERIDAIQKQITASGVTGGATLADRFKANVFAVATPAPAAAQPTTAK
jgi:predicted Zn-dependent protease